MRVPLFSLKRAVRLPLAGEFFETNPRMVLINDDHCDIADIVLDVWLFEKKFNHSGEHQGRLTVELLTDEITSRRAQNDEFSTLRRHSCRKIQANLH